MARFPLAAFLLGACIAGGAAAQPPDTVLVNGKILTLDARSSVQQALAIRDGKIASLGGDAQIRKLAGSNTRVLDLGGRTAIPGLIDSHLHAIRAALSFTSEVNWIGARSLPEALERIAAAARSREPGAWLIVAGGWNELQFAERRRPTRSELEAAAPGNPVYVQLGYGWVVMTDDGFAKLGIKGDADLPAGARLERDGSGAPTGAIAGNNNAIIALFDRLPRPTYAQQLEGTKAFFSELNRLALTGVVDPGGNNLVPADYRALFDVWRRGEMTVRVAYSVNGQTAGREYEELAELTAMLPMGFGDEYLKFNGIGERITLAMNNNPAPSDADKERYYEIAKWAAERGLTLTMHWGPDATVHHLLEVFERVNRDVPIAPLRWSIAHLNDASEQSLARMRALGVGWTVQDAMYFGGDALVRAQGPDAGRRIPPVLTGKRLGVAIGAGTDAHRVASYNPFTALQWFADGKTVGGRPIRGPEETPSREDALRFYTIGSAWFSHDDRKRGSLEVGKLADVAVLSADYLTVPTDEIGRIESVLTLLGGKVVYAAPPFSARANPRGR
ncbi:MAG TPA: amidohydrolase [Gammaproteobacteria bacterium]|nr:amidohydrolase [Gammaproteobacteria bacterium]